MAQRPSQGQFASIEAGRSLTWQTVYPVNSNPGIVIQNPNITDDPFVTPKIDVIGRSVQKTQSGQIFFATFFNPGPIPVSHNLNIQDWL